MASAQDILDAVNASNTKLDQLHADVVAGTNATNSVNNRLTDVEAHLDAGFTVLSQGQVVISELQVQTNAILAHLTAQTDTMICLLDAIARNTCALLNEASTQTAAQRQMRADLDDLVFLASTTEPAAALELTRAKEAEARMDECCPPEQADPPCEFDGCPPPKPFRPRKVDDTVPSYPYPPKRGDAPK